MAQKKDSQLKHIRFKPKDIEAIEKASDKLSMTFSAFIRLAALEKAKRTK